MPFRGREQDHEAARVYCPSRRAAIIWPLGTSAQQHIRRVAVLSVGVAPQSREFALAHELAKLGYIEGNNITYDIRGAEGDSSRLPELALELVAKKPDCGFHLNGGCGSGERDT